MAATETMIEGRRVAVTGAGGFIGNAVCRRLVAEGAEVTGIDLLPAAVEPVEAAGARAAIADITDGEAIARALDGAALVVHTAAIVSDVGAMEEHIRVNVQGTANVLDAAAAAGAERVLHVSSVVVYGYDDPSEQDESAFRRACGVPYIDTKSASDRLACRRGAVVVRPGDVYGPRSIPWSVRPLEMAKKGRLSVPGKGDGQMLPVYIDDLVEAVLLALRRGVPGEAYTVWDGQRLTFGEYLERIARLAGTSGPRRLPRPVMRGLGRLQELVHGLRSRPPPFTRHAVTLIDRRGSVSNRKAREELGWEPHVDLDEGLRRTEAWLREEGLI